MSFPTLEKNEMKTFGEYRTRSYVLQAFDALHRGELPTLANNAVSEGDAECRT